MVFGSNLTGLYSGLQALAAPAKTTTGPFVAAAPAEGMSDTSVALVAGALSGIVRGRGRFFFAKYLLRIRYDAATAVLGEAVGDAAGALALVATHRPRLRWVA